MVYQPPAGARDLLPLDVTQKRWIEKRLRSRFQRWGYHRIITSTLERLDTLMAGGAIGRSTVIQFQDADDEILGLRPELTASIARAAVTRMASTTFPQRLYYNANVFRRNSEGDHGQQQEFYQAGVELLGAGGMLADAEILLLLADCVQSLGLQGVSVIVGEAGLTRSLLEPFPPPLQEPVRRAISHLDRVALENLSLSPELRQRALFLFDLRGRPQDVLQQLAYLDLDAPARSALENLKALFELLDDHQQAIVQDNSPPPHSILDAPVLDLSLIQPLDYYTGIVFEVVGKMESGTRILGQGGRYDRLLSLYHPQGEDCPGIGFALNLEDLQQALQSSGQLPTQTPPSDWLIVPKTPQSQAASLAYAQKLRQSAQLLRVEVALGDHQTPETVRDYAQCRQIGQIAWMNVDGVPEIETLSS